MTAQISKSEQDERGLLPYPVIIAATKGDPEAMNIVVQHYESYIASLSMRKLRDERGNTYWGIDEDIRCFFTRFFVLTSTISPFSAIRCRQSLNGF